MYIRPVHAELDAATLHSFIRQYPLGLLTTSIPHPQHATIQTSHVPFVLDVSPIDHDHKGTLRGHMARANPQVKSMIHSDLNLNNTTSKDQDRPPSQSQPQLEPDYLTEEVLILFQAPVHSYITPQFYTSTKPSTGKVVPTWDYAAVQVYGKLKLYHHNDSTTSSFLTKQITDLTIQQERMAGHDDHTSWKVEDAPKNYTELLKKAIVGMEIEIERCEGRFKLSQESNQGDWEGVVEGFRAMGTAEGNGMVELIEQAGRKAGKDGNAVPPVT